jgi:hypothetical protein
LFSNLFFWKKVSDWDFFEETRKRQAKRMLDFAKKYKKRVHQNLILKN